MKVKELMTLNPKVCLATDSCSVAAGIMRCRDCGFVPVVDDPKTRKVIGVVTDRDILLHLAPLEAPLSAIPVKACMTAAVKTAHPEMDLRSAVDMMEEAAVHRLPVVDSEGRLVGVLALKDIAVAAQKEWVLAGAHPVERQMSELVEAISAAK